MKTLPALVLALVLPLQASVAAQETPPSEAAPTDMEAPPERLAAFELARSRACVPALAMLADLDVRLEPLHRRADRIQRLADAVALEDSTRAEPFDGSDPLEAAVLQWFAADLELALEYVSGGSEDVQERRTRAREEIRQRLLDALDAVGAEARDMIETAGDVDAAAAECEDAILVRSAVLEACESAESPVCDEARSGEPGGRYGFVDAPEDLWDVEEYRPWSEPSPLQRTPEGGVGGARTGTLSRRGNILLFLGLEPMIRDRSSLSEEEAAGFDANLEALGFEFEDPRYVMAPALTVRLNLSEALAGETHYLLHFGDLSDPANDVIWTGAPEGPGPILATFPASGAVLQALSAGDDVSLTAVRLNEGGDEADALFTLGVTSVGQARSVSGLLSYMAAGAFARDLRALLPPAEGGG